MFCLPCARRVFCLPFLAFDRVEGTLCIPCLTSSIQSEASINQSGFGSFLLLLFLSLLLSLLLLLLLGLCVCCLVVLLFFVVTDFVCVFLGLFLCWGFCFLWGSVMKVYKDARACQYEVVQSCET